MPYYFILINVNYEWNLILDCPEGIRYYRINGRGSRFTPEGVMEYQKGLIHFIFKYIANSLRGSHHQGYLNFKTLCPPGNTKYGQTHNSHSYASDIDTMAGK